MAQAIWDDKYIDVVDVDTTQWDMYSGGTTVVGQSFTSQGGILRRASFYLGKDGSPTGNVVARLRTHSGTYGTNSLPTGAVLATSENVLASSLSTTKYWINFDFTDEYELQDGTNYCIEVYYAGGDDVNNIQAGARVTGSHDGNCYSNTTASSYDMYFAVITSDSSDYAFDVSSWEELAAINSSELYLIQNYKLTTDLDSNSTGYDTYASSSANGGVGWIPVGDWDSYFSGSFDGSNHTITDLYINTGANNPAGLFGLIDSSTIKNLTLENVDITADYYGIGGLAGYLQSDCTVENCHVSGSVSSGGFGYAVGGLIGYVYNSTIEGCSSSGSVEGSRYIGGLIGEQDSLCVVTKSHSSCGVAGLREVGGFAGSQYLGQTSDCHSTGNITGYVYAGYQNIGGFVGYGGSTTTICYSTGDVYPCGSSGGGFAGVISDREYQRCYSTGSVFCSSALEEFGGFVGGLYEDISECYATGNVEASLSDYVAGFVAFAMASNISDSYSSGNVEGNSSVSGFGNMEGQLYFPNTADKCYSVGGVIGNASVSGFCENSDVSYNTITDSFWDTQTSGMATSDSGTGKTTVEMMDIDTFTNWSIQKYSTIPSSTWYIKEGEEYPQLTWTLPAVKIAQTPYYTGQGEKKYSVKVYDRAGTTFKGGYDPIGGYSFNKVVNGGVGDLTVELPRKFDQYGLGDDVNLLDEIQIWVQDKDTSGKRLYSGYVSGITSYVNGINQGIRLDVLGYASRLGFTLDTDGTTVGVVRNSMTPGEIAKDVIDKYRATVSEERINYGASTVDITGTDISYTSNTKSCLETIERAREMAGATWYWYVDADNIFYFKEYSTTPDHLFVFGKDVSSLEITRNADDIKNELIFWNGLQSGEGNFLSKRYYNADSITDYWNRFEKLTDSRIIDSTTADSLGSSFINAYKEPNVSMKFEVKDGNLGQGYDIESIEPGQTCKILNLDDSSVVGDNMVITSVRYTPESATVYVSDSRDITGRSLTNLRRQLDNTVYGDRPSNLTDSAVA